jgi:cation:H+ antiporter
LDFLNIVINVALLAAFLVVLDRSSYAVINGVTDISRSTGLAYTTLGFIVVSVSTSLPEAVVSLFATLEGEAGIAVGNILGSNIANVCLILGLPIVCAYALRTGSTKSLLQMRAEELSSLFFGLFVSSMLPLVLLRSSRYGPFVGVALVGLFVVYGYQLSKKTIVTDLPEALDTYGSKKLLVKGICWAAAGIAGVILGGYVIVYSALNLASAFGVSGTFIGATVIAVGTSLPELAVSMKSIQQKRLDFALGNAIGSCFANLTIILGLVFIFSKVAIRVDAYFDLVFFSLISNLFFWYFLSRGRLGLREGLILLLIYAVFLTEFIGVFTLF